MKPTPRGPLPFDEVVRRHGATVLRVCRAVLGPGPDADDAWSETFLSALRAWPGRGEPVVQNPEAWLVRIARRKTVDVIRARRAIPTVDLPEAVVDGADAGVDVDGVWDAVAGLPERQRLAVAYHYFGGLPHTETAAVIGGTPDAVRRSAADGLRTLRRTLDRDRFHPPGGVR